QLLVVESMNVDLRRGWLDGCGRVRAEGTAADQAGESKSGQQSNSQDHVTPHKGNAVGPTIIVVMLGPPATECRPSRATPRAIRAPPSTDKTVAPPQVLLGARKMQGWLTADQSSPRVGMSSDRRGSPRVHHPDLPDSDRH